ncbi:amidohydrolase family protein [Edaphobacter dinghuensis]|uniref:Amidohydrolase n=1 Tax=Edaphobacter dinghuensis TaxID=1560005 RepID=A0A917HH20_9BACT|nr:amidohydrolase family protein [Edaphobacter dinghuensis]GGG77824.1 amidohydrolase [Edaphobacter dinghuensis]
MKIFLLALMLVVSCCGVRAQDLAVVNAKVYTSPDSPPVNKASVLIQAGKITAVGRHLTIPPGVKTLPCDGCVVLAGFWNTHVHFMEPKWADAAHLPAEQLTRQLQEMLTHSGFTTVVDLGSDPSNTIALRRRIESGEVAGPHIYTAGIPLYPKDAIPFYLKDAPPSVVAMLGQPATPAEADTLVKRNIALGTDVVKLFTGSILTPSHVVPMRLDIVRAAVEEGHRHGQLVFAHPTNLEGTRVAMEGGVDVLAHAPENLAGIDDAFIAQLVAHHMVMIPTLKLFSQDADIANIRAAVKRFHQLGGPLMFGTDTGFLADYDMGEEYRQLSLAGLNYREVLAMLTTSPAQRFRVSEHKGRVAVGMNGDLTILSADPASGDPSAFTQVRYTVRNGRVIYRSH